MHKSILALVLFTVVTWLPAGRSEDKPTAFPSFRVQDVDTGLNVGWATLVADVNSDGKQDIIVVNPTHVVWLENPTWKKHTLIEGKTKPNNMTIAPIDLAGKGKLNFVLGGGWKPYETKDPASVVWLEPGKDRTAPWSPVVIGDETMTHRVRFADLLGEGKPQLVVAPLMGRESSLANNWLDGRPVRILLYRLPKEPSKDRWEPVAIDDSLHVVHGLTTVERPDRKGVDLLVASYEGVHRIARAGAGKWTRQQICAGNQEHPKGHRGSSEVKMGKLKNGRKFIATIEPWHGHQVVVYTEPAPSLPGGAGRVRGKLWDRHVIDEQLKWGHAVVCADLDGDGSDEMIVGVQHNLNDRPGMRRGVRLYRATDDKGGKWVRHILDDGGVAVEDLAVVDLSGNGRLDIVAVGLQSGAVRIFWSQGAR